MHNLVDILLYNKKNFPKKVDHLLCNYQCILNFLHHPYQELKCTAFHLDIHHHIFFLLYLQNKKIVHLYKFDHILDTFFDSVHNLLCIRDIYDFQGFPCNYNFCMLRNIFGKIHHHFRHII